MLRFISATFALHFAVFLMTAALTPGHQSAEASSIASDARQWTWEMGLRPQFKTVRYAPQRVARRSEPRRQSHSSRDTHRRDHRDDRRSYRSTDDWRDGDRDMRNHRDHERDGFQCIDRMRVVGSQFINKEGAEESAQKAFMEEVRFRWGESFMSIETAQDYESRCTRSSVGEVLNQVFFRCEIRASPCRPPFAVKGGAQ